MIAISDNFCNRNKYMLSYCLETTRRCNLQCNWCSKGDAQPIDMSPEMIDKALNEIEDYYIFEFRINGGEPCLNVGAIEQIVERIIERKLRIRSIVMFTNATIRNSRIKKALAKFAEYRQSDYGLKILAETDKAFPPDTITSVYVDSDHGTFPVSLVLSSLDHQNDSEYFETLEFYRMPGKIAVLRQMTKEDDDVEWTVDDKRGIIIEGRAARNFRDYGLGVLKKARLISNKYTILTDLDSILVYKIVSVSVCGDVFVGASASYEREHNERCFNIEDCHGDLLEQIGEWCWQYPLTKGADEIKSKWLAKQWKIENGIELSDFESVFIDPMHMLVDGLERYARHLHLEFPLLGHTELQMLAFYSWHLQMMDEHNRPNPKILGAVFRRLGYDISDEKIYSTETQHKCIETIKEIETRNMLNQQKHLETTRAKIDNDMAAIRAVWNAKETNDKK